ncbi:MAG: hypothetical protein KKF27_21635, partial [Gammaproteobacteria bacterium]|nr:hypothetical protein [Gammaproteobacteria bacterium]
MAAIDEIKKLFEDMKSEASGKIKEQGDALGKKAEEIEGKVNEFNKKMDERFAAIEEQLRQRRVSVPGSEDHGKQKFFFANAYRGLLLQAQNKSDPWK